MYLLHSSGTDKKLHPWLGKGACTFLPGTELVGQEEMEMEEEVGGR